VITVFITSLGLATEMKLAAVGLNPKPYRRHCEIEPGHVLPAALLQLKLAFDRWQRGIGHDALDQALEPGITQSLAGLKSIEQSQNDAGSGHARPVQALRRVADPSKRRSTSPGVIKRPLDQVHGYDIAQIGQRPGEICAWY